MEKYCPKCFKKYAESLSRCPEDGTTLILPSERDLTGEILDDRYRVLECIGRGGMGVVYKAEQQLIGRVVALKVLRREVASDESSVKRFLNEARAIASLDNRHTVTLHDFGVTSDGLLYYTMELLKGRSLSRVIRDESPLELGRAVELVAQVCSSLEEAHSQGILHRDLKPDNLFVLEKGGREEVKVLDFGIAKLVGDNSMDSVTKTGIIVGTPQYLSPEQALGNPVVPASDLYSLATLFFEMLSGAPPFFDETPMKTMLAHIREPLPPVSKINPSVQIPAEMEAFICRAMEKDPDDRYPSAVEFRDAMLQATPEELRNPVRQTPVQRNDAPGSGRRPDTGTRRTNVFSDEFSSAETSIDRTTDSTRRAFLEEQARKAAARQGTGQGIRPKTGPTEKPTTGPSARAASGRGTGPSTKPGARTGERPITRISKEAIEQDATDDAGFDIEPDLDVRSYSPARRYLPIMVAVGLLVAGAGLFFLLRSNDQKPIVSSELAQSSPVQEAPAAEASPAPPVEVPAPPVAPAPASIERAVEKELAESGVAPALQAEAVAQPREELRQKRAAMKAAKAKLAERKKEADEKKAEQKKEAGEKASGAGDKERGWKLLVQASSELNAGNLDFAYGHMTEAKELLGQTPELADLFQRHSQAKKKQEIRKLLSQGKGMMKSGNYDGALKVFQEAVDKGASAGEVGPLMKECRDKKELDSLKF